MAVAACNVNLVNVYMIAYRVHVYTRASLITESKSHRYPLEYPLPTFHS